MKKFLAVLTSFALVAVGVLVVAPNARHLSKPLQAQQFATCLANTATPENCQSACSGFFTISGATATVVNTNCVTATSRILLTIDSSIGSQLPSAPTCSAATPVVTVTARSAGLSFTVTPSATFTTNGCVAFRIDAQT